MRVVDTSAWIEWLTGSPLGASLATELPDIAQWLVPTIIQLELAKWLTREVRISRLYPVCALSPNQADLGRFRKPRLRRTRSGHR
jgi:uncharacterized protein with PIN domain